MQTNWIKATEKPDTREPIAAVNGKPREGAMFVLTMPSGKTAERFVTGTMAQWDQAVDGYVAVEKDERGTVYLRPAVPTTGIVAGDDGYDELEAIAKPALVAQKHDDVPA